MVPVGGCGDALSDVDNEACRKYDVCTAHNGEKIVGPPIFVSRNDIQLHVAKKDGRHQNCSTNIMQSKIAHEGNHDGRPNRGFNHSLEAIASVDGVIREKDPVDCHLSEDVVSVQSHISHSLSDPEGERKELTIGQTEMQWRKNATEKNLFNKISQKILYNLAGADTYDSDADVMEQKQKEEKGKRFLKMNR
eukprot:17469_1